MIETTAPLLCQYADPFCPCNDGDGCNYEDDPETGTKGLPAPGAEPAHGGG